MFFEAEVNSKKYLVTVQEERKTWKIGLKREDQDWIHYSIDRNHYQELENTVLFLFKHSSYIMDVMGQGTQYEVFTRGSYRTVQIYNDEMILHESLKDSGSMGNETYLRAGMPGKIMKVIVSKGEKVQKGQPVLIMEAMKMENEMRASRDCLVSEIFVEEGQGVESGADLMAFEDLPDGAN